MENEVFEHEVKLKKGLSRKGAGNIISDIEKSYEYDPVTGTFNAIFILPEGKVTNGKDILFMGFFVGKNLSDEELNQIVVKLDFSYCPETGALNVIHKFVR